MGLDNVNEEMFDKAVAKHQEEKAAEKQRGNFPQRNFEEQTYSALQKDRLKFVRVMGVPMDQRQAHDPYYSPKLIYLTWITDDSGKKMRVIWPNRTDDRDWPLYRIMDKVLAYDYNREKDSKDYHYQNQHPKLFYRVSRNMKIRQLDIKPDGSLTKECKESINPIEKGWKPTQYVVVNVIDRAMTDWHKENKHTALLSKKVTQKTREDGTNYFIYEPGVPKKVYDLLMSDEIAGTYHNFLDYDVIIKKIDSDPWYKMYHPENEKMFINPHAKDKEDFIKQYPFYNPEVHLRKLTDEELSWERYNLDQIFKVTSYQKILNRLGKFIKEYDQTFNDDLFSEVKYLAEREKEQYQEEDEDNEKESDTTTTSSTPVQKPEPVTETKEPEKEENPLPTRERSKDKSNEENNFDLESFKERGFEGIDSLTEKEKDKIIGYNEKEENFIYNTDEELYSCVNSKDEDNPCPMTTPESFHVCPKCGVEF